MKFLSVLASVLMISFSLSAQQQNCNLWLGDTYDSIEVIKQTTEKFLGTQLKMLPNEDVKTMYEFRDADEFAQMKVWMKQKKAVSGGTLTTFYAMNSFRIIGEAERIQALFNFLKEKVSGCAGATTELSVQFGGGKMSIEKQGGDWSKKNVQLYTLTVASLK